MYTTAQVIQELKNLGSADRLEKAKYFGVQADTMLGVSMPDIRALAKKIGIQHSLALALWDTNIHECRILASMLADAKLFTPQDADKWIHDFNAWDICDQCCCNLLYKLPYIKEKIKQYYNAPQEYVKRFAFAMMAVGAVHWKKVDNDFFEEFYPMINEQSYDDRNFVRKAINWAIRQIGKRNLQLNDKAIALCEQLLTQNNKAATWIAKDALKELTSAEKQTRLMNQELKKKPNAAK
jgi:3-methyladenine DNA glycosylase AlkD